MNTEKILKSLEFDELRDHDTDISLDDKNKSISTIRTAKNKVNLRIGKTSADKLYMGVGNKPRNCKVAPKFGDSNLKSANISCHKRVCEKTLVQIKESLPLYNKYLSKKDFGNSTNNKSPFKIY